ncbi:MAG: hypothetical protein M3Z87_09260 [Lactobacillus sp.]|nr:hypothetical protein [Lactobacillus sp.]
MDELSNDTKIEIRSLLTDAVVAYFTDQNSIYTEQVKEIAQKLELPYKVLKKKLDMKLFKRQMNFIEETIDDGYSIVWDVYNDTH